MCRYPTEMAWLTALSTSPGADCQVPAVVREWPREYNVQMGDIPRPNAGISAPVLSLKRTSAAAVIVNIYNNMVLGEKNYMQKEKRKEKRRLKRGTSIAILSMMMCYYPSNPRRQSRPNSLRSTPRGIVHIHTLNTVGFGDVYSFNTRVDHPRFPETRLDSCTIDCMISTPMHRKPESRRIRRNEFAANNQTLIWPSGMAILSRF